MIAMSSVVDKELGTIILFGGSKMEGESNDLYYIKMNEL